MTTINCNDLKKGKKNISTNIDKENINIPLYNLVVFILRIAARIILSENNTCFHYNLIYFLFQIIMFRNNLTKFCPLCQENGLKNKLFKFESCQYANQSLFFCPSSEVIMINNL